MRASGARISLTTPGDARSSRGAAGFGAGRIRVAGSDDPVEALHHVLRGQRRAVVEPDAVAETEGPRRARRATPTTATASPGSTSLATVAVLHEGVEDLAGDERARALRARWPDRGAAGRTGRPTRRTRPGPRRAGAGTPRTSTKSSEPEHGTHMPVIRTESPRRAIGTARIGCSRGARRASAESRPVGRRIVSMAPNVHCMESSSRNSERSGTRCRVSRLRRVPSGVTPSANRKK